MNALTTPAEIARFQLLALRGAVKLEGLGMTRRGTSATMIARQRYGLPRNAPRDQVLQCIEVELAK